MIRLVFLGLLLVAGQELSAQLRSTYNQALVGFNNPQDSTRTKVWWFHGDVQTTREGITADLEAFKKAGIGGVVYYDQSHGAAPEAIPGMSPEWWNYLKFAGRESKRLGLSFEVNVSNGFVAGGPWIKPENGMKRLVATEILVDGGTDLQVQLPEPKNRLNYYKDIAILAVPAGIGSGKSSAHSNRVVTCTEPEIDIRKLFDPNAESLVSIPNPGTGKSVIINIEFQDPLEARSITYQVKPKGKATTSATNVPAAPGPIFVGTGYRVLPMLGQLECSDDGINYKKVCDLRPIYIAHESWKQKTISFNASKSRFFRLNLHDWAESTDTDSNLQLGNVVINGEARVDQWEEKAALFSEYIENDRTPAYSIDESIDPKSVIDLTSKTDNQGVLRWEAPSGKWKIMRFSQICTGGSLKHGRKNLMGLECDKLAPKGAEIQFTNYFKPILDTLRREKIDVEGMIMDSHEAGSQNWTDDFLEQFTTRNGYSLLPYLPVMWGHVVGSAKSSTDVLTDVRRTIADLIAENYYGTFQRLCSREHVTLTAQATGNALCIVADPIYAKSMVDKPQGEFWMIHPNGNYDIKESSSSAHLYGKPIASAEAFTDAHYENSLAQFKSLADYAYSFGINEFVVCASAYQPWIGKFPGNTSGGRHYCVNRNNTWWDYSRPFWDFQSRVTYLMRLGKSTADYCLYLGENAPVKILTYRLPEFPGGYDFDAFTSDALLNRMHAENQCITLPDGIHYKMMILPRNGEITYSALRKIAELVESGISIYGVRPSGSNSGKDVEKKEAYRLLVEKLWGPEGTATGVRNVGKGKVYFGISLAEATNLAGIIPDLALGTGNSHDNLIYFTHRKLKDADIYYIDNHKDKEENNQFTFHSTYQNGQIWNCVTGERFSLTKSGSGTLFSTTLKMAPRESFVVVLSDRTEKSLSGFDNHQFINEQKVTGSWEITFNTRMGGPGTINSSHLFDWTSSQDPSIRYYSGTAIYRSEIQIDRLPSSNERLLLDLKQVFAAKVFINTQEAGIVWCSPYQIDITKWVKKGINQLEIHVANPLTNRMIYDSTLPPEKRITFAETVIVKPTDPLIPSGLIEPIRLVWTKK